MKNFPVATYIVFINILSVLLFIGIIFFLFVAISMNKEFYLIIAVTLKLFILFILLKFSGTLMKETYEKADTITKDYNISLALSLLVICWLVDILITLFFKIKGL